MRAGFDRIAMLIREQMGQNLLDGDLFLFLGRNRKRLKGLCFDGTGLLLFSKRLEKGVFMKLSEMETYEISREEMDQLLSGSLIRRRRFGEEALTLPSSRINMPGHEAFGARNQC